MVLVELDAVTTGIAVFTVTVSDISSAQVAEHPNCAGCQAFRVSMLKSVALVPVTELTVLAPLAKSNL